MAGVVEQYLQRGSAILAALAACFAAGGQPVHAQKTPSPPAYHTPKPGSPERKAIMDALRVPVEKDVEMKVIFVVDKPEMYFRVVGDWAFVGAEFRHPDGSPMGTEYRAKHEMSSLRAEGLLHREHGRWIVVTHVTGPTDVEWQDWPKKYHAPTNVIPKL